MPDIRHALFIAPVTHRKKTFLQGAGTFRGAGKPEAGKKASRPSKKTASSIRMKRFSSMVTHTVFLHGTAGGAGGGINVTADGFHVLAYSADRMAGNTPKKGGDTQNNQFAFHRFIGRVPSGQTPFLRTPFKEPFMMPHRRSCHSPFLPCAPATLKKHASTGENIRRTFRPRSRNHYYLLPR